MAKGYSLWAFCSPLLCFSWSCSYILCTGGHFEPSSALLKNYCTTVVLDTFHTCGRSSWFYLFFVSCYFTWTRDTIFSQVLTVLNSIIACLPEHCVERSWYEALENATFCIITLFATNCFLQCTCTHTTHEHVDYLWYKLYSLHVLLLSFVHVFALVVQAGMKV